MPALIFGAAAGEHGGLGHGHAVELQHAALDRRCAGVGVGARQVPGAAAGLDETATAAELAGVEIIGVVAADGQGDVSAGAGQCQALAAFQTAKRGGSQAAEAERTAGKVDRALSKGIADAQASECRR